MLTAKRLGILIVGIAMLLSAPCYGKSREQPVGLVRSLAPAEVETLTACLKDTTSEWGLKALRYYYGSTYLSELPDLVIYVSRGDKVKQQLIVDDRVVKGKWPRLCGEKYIYVHVFMVDMLAAADTAKAAVCCSCPRPVGAEAKAREKKADIMKLLIQVHRSSLDYRPDPVIRRALGAFESVLANVKPGEIAVGLRDSDSATTLCDLGTGRDKSWHLFLGYCKMPIAENSWTRITICGNRLESLGHARSVITNFSNTSSSPYAFGLALAAAWKEPRKATALSARWSLYVYGTVYICNPPALPMRGVSLGASLGTSVAPGKLLDDLMIGLSAKYRRLPTLLCGATFSSRSGQKDGSHKRRVAGAFIGFGFEL